MSASVRTGPLARIAAVLAAASLAFNATHAIPPKEKEPWKTGYWIWAGEPPVSTGFKAEILYVEVLGHRWPRALPDADQYVVVRRIELAEELTAETASALVENYKALIADAGGGVHIAGLQIDYDCPTNKLESYGRFLKRVRQHLPAGSHLSITALLDWFRPHTTIAHALKWVDEFVPQFYDAGPARVSAGIAEPIDALKWAPVFNAYQVPYRIGISSFGRMARRRLDASGHSSVQYFRDASPLDFAQRRQFTRSTSATPAGELVVRYDVVAPIPEKPELRTGDAVEITFPTEALVRTALEAVRRFGGYCAGAIFFRWPNRSETLALAPDDVRRIAAGETLLAGAHLEVRGASCIARQCSDLYVDLGHAAGSIDRAIGIRAIGPAEVFLAGGPLRPLGCHPAMAVPGCRKSGIPIAHCSPRT